MVKNLEHCGVDHNTTTTSTCTTTTTTTTLSNDDVEVRFIIREEKTPHVTSNISEFLHRHPYHLQDEDEDEEEEEEEYEEEEDEEEDEEDEHDKELASTRFHSRSFTNKKLLKPSSSGCQRPEDKSCTISKNHHIKSKHPHGPADSHCQCQPGTAESREFRKRWLFLSEEERLNSLRASFDDFATTASELLPCLGCRNSTESLLQRLSGGKEECHLNRTVPPPLVVNSGLLISSNETFSLNSFYLSNSDATLSLFLHQERWAQNGGLKPGGRYGNKSNSRARCFLHSQRARSGPRPAAFETLWKKLPDDHRQHLSHIDSDQFLTDLESYLRRHRFCCRCKEKVLEAYDLLIGSAGCSDEDCGDEDCEDCNVNDDDDDEDEDDDYSNFGCLNGDPSSSSVLHSHQHNHHSSELQYTSYLFDELSYSRSSRSIVIPCTLDFMSQLMSRADQELVGDWGDRHARTIAEAQDEVLTCLGMVIWEKCQAIWMRSRSEKRSEELLVYLAVTTLRKKLETTVEKLHGQEMMEQLLAEEEEDTRRLIRKKEKRKNKKKKRKVKLQLQQQKKQDKKAEQNNLLVLSQQQNNNSSKTRNNSQKSKDGSSCCSSNCSSSSSSSSSSIGRKTTQIDEEAELQLLSSMGWSKSTNNQNEDDDADQPELDKIVVDKHNSDKEEDPSNEDPSSEVQETIQDDDHFISQDEILRWKEEKKKLVSSRLEQRQKLQEKFNQFVLRNNNSSIM